MIYHLFQTHPKAIIWGSSDWPDSNSVIILCVSHLNSFLYLFVWFNFKWATSNPTNFHEDFSLPSQLSVFTFGYGTRHLLPFDQFSLEFFISQALPVRQLWAMDDCRQPGVGCLSWDQWSVDLMDILPLLHDECLVIYNLCQCVGVEMFLHFNHLYIFFSKLEVVVIYETVDGRNPAPPRMYKTL